MTISIKSLLELGITPIPWEVLDDGTTVVCEIDKDNDIYGDIAVCDSGSYEIDAANARLISAAPELYWWLRVAVLEACRDCEDTELSHCDGNCFVARWRKALAKAGGEKEPNQ